ncbi:tripartite tricarboxylate transporter TctB family protein [Frigidibacter sp. MR17.24]|uniref:tripartite tricarboxylate transporter TctB family protein n=1 Tax=Frigidibacter sp. MR17.24 TaxID=3127345 RepID=UPI003012C12E
MSDRIFGIIGLVLAVIYAWQASVIEESFLSDVVGPKAFPYIIAALLGLSSIFFLLKPDPEPEWPTWGRFAEIVFAVLVFVAYTELLPVLGFVVATVFCAAYLSWRLGSRPLGALLTGIGSSVGIYVVFHLLLGLALARGPWGF